ncbi:MAG: TIR domain-containing protein, partial [Pseudomonadota bacterium]|nr:TIR domain-containing protein [Pseudomonadota bacterium]
MKNTIFVSYSWEDEHWRSEIYRQLNAIIKNTSPDPNIEVWIDEEKLRTGDTIDQKITEAIERTKVAALLISADFLTSDYIRNTELPYLCEKGVRLFPILVEPCPFLSIPWLEKMLLKGARNEKNELIPLSNTRTDPDRKISTVARQILSDAAEEIVEIMRGKSSYDRPDCSQLLNLEAPAAEVPDAPPQDREETAAPSHDPQSSSTDDKGGAIAQGAADHSKLDGYPRRDNRYVEVELTLQHRDIDYYQAELRLTQSDDDNERYPHFIYLDTKALSEQAQDVESYGKTLTESLFPEKSRRASIILEKALLKAKKLDVPVRIRICISPTAMELHAVQWEALKNPLSPTSGWLMDPSADDGKWPAIAFSRHVMGSDQRWREVHLRAKPMGNPRALVVVSVPSDGSLREHGDKLQPIVRRQQENLAVQRLDGLTAEQLSETADRATLDDLVEALSDPQGWDILYLVCHFTIDDRRTMVLLEDRNGDASPVATRDLVDRIGDLRVPPRALVLVSGTCEDAESNRISDQRCGLMKAGAILLQSGIPVALIADGNGPPQQLDAMLPQFLNHLQSENPNSDGRADEALEKARRAVEENHWDPWWTPVLVSRQKTTRTWYSPGFLKVEQSEASWERLLK